MNLSSLPRLAIQKAGSLIGRRRTLNFVEGSNVTLTVQDDAGNNRVNCTIASSGGGVSYGHAMYRSGQSYWPAGCTGAFGTTLAIPADYVYLMPYPVSRDVTFDAFEISLQTGAVGGTGLMALYNVASDGTPTDTALESGTFSTQNAGVKTATITPTAVSAGNYWIAFVGDLAVTAYKSSSGILVGAEAFSTTSAISVWRRAHTWDSSMPDLTGLSLSTISTEPTSMRMRVD